MSETAALRHSNKKARSYYRTAYRAGAQKLMEHPVYAFHRVGVDKKTRKVLIFERWRRKVHLNVVLEEEEFEAVLRQLERPSKFQLIEDPRNI